MEEISKHGQLVRAAMKADMDPKTARKYIASGLLPSQMVQERNWRTREDPFADIWPEIEARLVEFPELEAKALFEAICEEHPGCYEPGQLRTLQRRLKSWRAKYGPPKGIFFAQVH